jgi:NAD(P)-dependent dehydrogenase (short-subunit alcohol dehydrogenase family)
MKTCLITGATSGIGKATASALAEAGCSLVLTGRNAKKGTKIINSLTSKFKNQQFEFIAADLSSIKEVNQLTQTIKFKYSTIDILINNAGARFNDFHKSEDGVELTFAINHLGHFLLTLSLLDLIKKSPSGRIINISSSAHGSSKTDFTEINNPNHYDRKKAYSDSKLANLLFTYELADRLKNTGITVNAVNPGGVLTNLGKNNGYFAWFKHIIYHLLKRELQFPSRAAKDIFYLADSDQVSGITGKYFNKRKETKSSPRSYNKEIPVRLWELSSRLCGLNIPSDSPTINI